MCPFVSIPDRFSGFTNYIKSAKVFVYPREPEETRWIRMEREILHRPWLTRKQRALTCLLNGHLCRQLLDRRGALMGIPKARPANIFNNYAGLINCAINLNKSPLAHATAGILAQKFIS